jgi:hypothetical protein
VYTSRLQYPKLKVVTDDKKEGENMEAVGNVRRERGCYDLFGGDGGNRIRAAEFLPT